MAGSTFTRLAKRLEKEFPELGPLDPDKFDRTYSGVWQKMQGACTWSYVGPPQILGGDTATNMLRAKRLGITHGTRLCDDTWIDVDDIPEKEPNHD